jgi:DNA-binding CsgD family transcriptional regulator
VIDLVGRDSELAVLLEAVRAPGPGIVTLVGAAGMGKTALIRALLGSLDGPLVLTARPLETEKALAFSGLVDLLADLPASAYADLPGPQRSSLRAALLLEEVPGGADPRAVAAGVRAVLAKHAQTRHVVLVLDDVQWLDRASCSALGQALHRIGAAPVVLVCATRPSSKDLDWLAATEVARTDVQLAPLPAEDLGRIVHHHLGPILEIGNLRGVALAAGGNPLHALELARHTLTAGAGATVEQLVRDRLNVLPRETRLALLTAALCSDRHLEVIAQARSCLSVELAAVLDPALRAGLVTIDDVLRFAHPLYAEAAISAGSSPDRTEAHLRLATTEPSEEARAWHAGLATEGPDEDLASTLARTAANTRARGAWDAAVDLLALAVTRTPVDSPERPDRALLLGNWALAGGQPSVAERWFRDVRRLHRGSTGYWLATIGLARLCLLAGRRDELHALNRELLTANLDPLLAAEAMVRTVHDELTDRPEAQLQRITAANHVLTDAGGRADPTVLLAGLSLEIQSRMILGQPTAELLARAVDLDARSPAAVALDGPALQLAHLAMMADRFEEGRVLCQRLLQRCRDVGDDVSLPVVYSHLGHLEQRAGRWDVARATLREGEQWAQGQGQLSRWQLRAQGAMIDGIRGESATALATLHEASQLFAAAEFLPFRAIVWHLSGRIHAAVGDHAEAFDAFGRAIDFARQAGWDDPANLEADVPFVEAAVALGRLDEAEEHLAHTETRARELGQDNALAVCARGRVGLAAARGDLEQAAGLVPPLLSAYEVEPGQPMDRALALLVAGRVHRRTRQKRLAHESLSGALAIFDQLGSKPYSDQVRAELRRVGLRPSRPEALTPTEAEVTRMAADGLRNAEIATGAHLSRKTVEAVLSRSYRKLGIRSRAQLERALARLAAKPDE